MGFGNEYHSVCWVLDADWSIKTISHTLDCDWLPKIGWYLHVISMPWLDTTSNQWGAICVILTHSISMSTKDAEVCNHSFASSLRIKYSAFITLNSTISEVKRVWSLNHKQGMRSLRCNCFYYKHLTKNDVNNQRIVLGSQLVVLNFVILKS